eukprot:scaffold15259_cov122-Cylindrotheca_fusiformis.AAC.5
MHGVRWWAVGIMLLSTTRMLAHGFQFRSHQYVAKSFTRTRCAGNAGVALFMSTEAQRTIAEGSHNSEMEVKKSRFIGYAKHAETWDEAQQYIQEVKSLHPKARHWCYGACFGANPVSERCSDDGEPTGTAGQPILNAINGEDLSDVVCVVVRYFGGIKLGAGGLIRSYGASARQVLREAPVDVLIPKCSFRVSAGASHIGSIYDCVAKAGGSTSGEEYGADASLVVTICCDLAVAEQLRESLNDATRGQRECWAKRVAMPKEGAVKFDMEAQPDLNEDL